VDAITAQGGTASDAFTKIRAGWVAATSDPTTADLEDAIIVAIGTGDAGKVEAAMLAAQLAKGDRSQIRGRIARAVLPALRTAYAATAADNYSAIAKGYDEAAGKLAGCAAAVDITLDAEKIVGLSAKAGTAWMDSATVAAELDGLLAALVGAANLAGIATVSVAGGPLTGAVIALACDPGTAHRRRVFEAWESRGRCGRWAALLALGVTLRAADLDGFAPYADPKPLEVRQQRSGMGVRQVTVDPEDQDYQPVSTDHRTPAEIASAKATVDAWNKLGQPKTTAATE
jgi:hypothetical protein